MPTNLPFILPLADPRANLATVGGKGASLARLAQAGLPVPGGFHVTTAAYREFVAAHGLQPHILAALQQADATQPAALEAASQAIGRLFQPDALPPALTEAIRQGYATLPGDAPAVAVRSSATAEDLPEASFAGQQETYLNVRGADLLSEAIRKCWASLWTARAIAYRLRQGIDPESLALAVVVQLLVPAEAAGVLFTADPVSGSRSQAVINAAWGLGQAVVAGAVTPDTITVDKTSQRVLHRHTAEKQVMTVPMDAGASEQPTPGFLARKPVLNDTQAIALARLGQQIENLYQVPMDIEWALAGGELAILQARPITHKQDASPAIPRTSDPDPFSWNDSLKGDYLWSNTNFGEAAPDVMTPLTWSVIRFTLHDWIYVPGVATVGNICGRLYINVSVFASVFRAMGQGRAHLLRAMEGTLYLNLPGETEIPAVPVPWQKVLPFFRQLLHTQRKHQQGQKHLLAYLTSNPAWFNRTRQKLSEIQTNAELLTLWQNEISSHILQAAWIVRGSATAASDYTNQLRHELIRLVGPEHASTLIANLSQPTSLLPSLGPAVGLSQVAGGQMPLETYLEQYGHRGPHEFEISMPRPVEDPAWLHAQIEGFRAVPVDVQGLVTRQKDAYDAAWEALQRQYPRKAPSIQRKLHESARRARLREQARSEYVRDRWTMRLFALQAAALNGLGNEVFFLTMEELLNLLAGDRSAARFIAERQEVYQRYQSLPRYPSVIRGRFDAFPWAANPQRRSDLYEEQAQANTSGSSRFLQGSPGSAGQVEGVVRIIEHPDQGGQLQPGEILVTTQTDIAWTVIFPRAAAVVTDVGAVLSHAAIIARELGIPAVVGCREATTRLKSGERVRVDGSRGTVEILDFNPQNDI